MRRHTAGLTAAVSLAALMAAALAASGCARESRPNLLIVSLDTTRADHLSAYGYAEPTTPNLERYAALGTLFEQARAHVPSTLPSHATLFTGLLPPSHGVRCNGRMRLPESAETLAEVLSAAGWRTGAVAGAFPIEHRFGLAQGFAQYDDDFGGAPNTGFWLGNSTGAFERDASQVTDHALGWVERSASPWFLFAHYFDAHQPYSPPSPERDRFALPYDGEVAFVDRQMGRLIDAVLKRAPNTLVVIVADHGESLGEHGEEWHNRYLYDATLHVPLVVVWPGHVKAAKRVAVPIGLVDVMPTVLDLFALPPLKRTDGRSLAPALLGDAPPAPRDLYAETLVWRYEENKGIEVRALLSNGFKAIETRSPRPQEEGLELYEIAADPRESSNLAEAQSDKAGALREQLRQWSEGLERRGVPLEALPLDPEAEKKLK
ncbi:MAG TPA: sulfatase, partial [Candidatus Polarisedimenticolia bacterium]|nr:sulfatase [Candidatus Polarisedimenticolia bacterium]